MSITSEYQESFIIKAAQDSAHAAVTLLGRSVQNRPIYSVAFGPGRSNSNARADIVFVATQHGTETAGREAALARISEWVSSPPAFLSEWTIVIVPTANPDGVIAQTRGNANGVDLNRNWVMLDQPETRAIAPMLAKRQPNLLVDMHEYGTANTAGRYSIEFNRSASRNGNSALTSAGTNLRAYVIGAAIGRGNTSGLYGGTTTVNPGQATLNGSAQWRHSVGLLVETRRRSPNVAMSVRKQLQTEAMNDIFAWYASNRSTVQSASLTSRSQAITRGETHVAPTFSDGTSPSPVPKAYRPTYSQLESAKRQINAFSIKVDSYGRVLTAQESWAMIAELMDPGSPNKLIDANPIYILDDVPEDSYSGDLKKLLEEADAAFAQPRLIAEWNWNRYAEPEVVSQPIAGEDPQRGFDLELFPLDSVILPNRPPQGIVKAVPGGAVAVEGFEVSPPKTRYYVADEEDLYKYWVAEHTAMNGSGPYTFATGERPDVRVTYNRLISTNKIVVGFETHTVRPVAFSIQTTVDGVSWTTISSNPVIDDKGVVTLYLQNNGSWSTTVNQTSDTQEIRGVRLLVTSLNRRGYYMSLIEISARLERDLTEYMLSYSDDFEISDASLISPLGKASSNTGTITLSNTDGIFDNENQSSPFYHIIDHNVLFTVDMVYDMEKSGFGTGQEPVRMMTMYTDDWSGQGETEISVSLKDYSKFLQEDTLDPALHEEVTLGGLVWTVCDSLGFTNYRYDSRAVDPATMIPYFWIDGEKTAWEIFAELAEATQSAIYFDEYGTLRIQTRDFAFNSNKLDGDPDWVISSDPIFEKKPDLINVSMNTEFAANKVNVKYKPIKISDDQNGLPKMETIWEPDGTLTLRSSNLVKDMTPTSSPMWISTSDAKVWPYEGLLQIEGEIIRYRGKGYYWYRPNGTRAHSTVYSAEDKRKLDDESSANLRWQNGFSGRINNLTRGEWNTTPRPHKVEASGYTKVRYRRNSVKPVAWQSGFVHSKQNSMLTLKTDTSWFPNNDCFYVVRRGSNNDQGYNYIGTRMKLRAAAGVQGGAGIIFNIEHTTNNIAAYYVELKRSRVVEKENRKWSHEISLYSIMTNGSMRRFGNNSGKGTPIQIADNVWTDIDIKFSELGGHRINVFVNGVNRVTANIESAFRHPSAGRFGMFVRGRAIADFEYLYGIRGQHAGMDLEGLDGSAFFDRIQGGYMSSQWDREWVYRWREATRIVKGKSKKYRQRYNQAVMDEFGPIVHEIREFDVKFDKYPNLHSRIYFTNEGQVICPEYRADPFGAQFVLANASRNNAVVSGEDKITFGADNPVDQKIMIYGRQIYQEEEKEYTVEDRNGILRRGVIELDIENDWIQSEAMAKDIGDWIVKQWGAGCDEVTVQIFGNPLIKLGDFVAINYPERSMSADTHRYFVISRSQSFTTGLTTYLTLRRAR